MGQKEIVEKLNTFLDKHMPFTEECHVVYLLVETRKILDKKDNKKYPIVRFYCNWSVHIDKHSTEEMKAIIEGIFQAIKKQIADSALPSIRYNKVTISYIRKNYDKN
jgi:hypothetical protein